MADIKEDNVDADGCQVRSTLDADGRLEYPDPTPMGVPLGYRPSPTLRDTIERIMMNHQLAVLADMEGFDSPAEADDFEIEDDPLDPLTPYEAVFFPPKELTPAERFGSDGSASNKGVTDGSPNVDERGVADSDGGSGRRDQVREGQSVQKSNADDSRSVHEANRGVAGSKE